MPDRSRAFQGLMILAGIALVVAGLNGSTPLAISGGVLILIALGARVTRGGRGH